jgi:hypothetical protein
MSATPDPHGPTDPALDTDADDDFNDALPLRPKRPFLTKWSAGLIAIAVTAIGFYGGVELEKSKTTSTGASSALASATGATRAGGTTRRGASGGALGGFAGAASNGTTGTVSSVDGKTIYLKDSAGDTVKAKLSSGTTITKSEKVGNGKVYPGDSVVISGTTAKNGEITATAVTDSGAGSSTSSSSTTS